MPPLVTTSPAGTAQAQAGVLGQPGTTVLFGGDAVNTAAHSGGRVVLGWWLDPTARIEGEFFGLGQQTTSFNQSSAGTPILARPFTLLGDGTTTTIAQLDSHVVAFPGTQSGSVQSSVSSSFLGAGVHATQNLTFCNYGCDRQHRLDLIYGFRYLHLNENLSINDSTTSTGGGIVPVGTTLATSDGFRTTNNFYGANLGLMTESRAGRGALLPPPGWPSVARRNESPFREAP